MDITFIPGTSGTASPKLPPLTQFAQRLASRLGIHGAGADLVSVAEAASALSPARLRATLIGMGLTPSVLNQALADSFARLGLALTCPALAEAHAALAQAPDASPHSYAFARAWSLLPTPAILNALTAVTRDLNAPVSEPMPQELLSWLGLAVDPQLPSEELAAHLFLMAQGMGRSTENRLTDSHPMPALMSIQDARSTLLRLSQGSSDRAIQQGANALATHIEGQQLVNQVMRRESGPQPFYLSVPVLLGGEAVMAEMRLGTWDDEQDAQHLPPETPWLHATLRLATERLGRMQVSLSGTLAGTLTCRLQAEKPATVRLFQRHSSLLETALACTGDWHVESIACQLLSEWPPLWHGGEAFASPRPCVDWRA